MIKVGDNLKGYLLQNNNNSQINHAIASHLWYYYKGCKVLATRCWLKNEAGNKIVQVTYSYRDNAEDNIFLLYQNDKLYNFFMIVSVGKITAYKDYVHVQNHNTSIYVYVNNLTIT